MLRPSSLATKSTQFPFTTVTSEASGVSGGWAVSVGEAVASTPPEAAAGFPSPVKLAWVPPVVLTGEVAALAFALGCLTLIVCLSLPILTGKCEKQARESTAAMCVWHKVCACR